MVCHEFSIFIKLHVFHANKYCDVFVLRTVYVLIPREPHCVALYDFNAEGPGELSIRTGDVIVLVEMVDTDWIKGRLKGQEGIFPSGFVEIKVALPPKSKIVTSAPPPIPGTQSAGIY